MVVCHCLAVNDLAITEVAVDPHATVDDVIALCGAGGRCGGCRDSIEWVLAKARRARMTEFEVAVALPA